MHPALPGYHRICLVQENSICTFIQIKNGVHMHISWIWMMDEIYNKTFFISLKYYILLNNWLI